MSYDLYFVSRGGQPIDAAGVEEYFRGRSHVTCNRPEYTYANDDTGVYFHFTVDEGAPSPESGDSPVAFNINFFRPSYFILEAEPEVTAFVKAFDLTVIDPQTNGMGEGEYDQARLIGGWNTGNEFAYRVMVHSEGTTPDDLLSMPSATLLASWRWNHCRHQLQEGLGQDIFVPRISFMKVDGVLSTVAVWPDAIPVAIRPVDRFIIGREQLAPRRWFMRRKDRVVITWEQAVPWLEKYRSGKHAEFIELDFSEPPR